MQDIPNLDDVNKTVFCIPYNPKDEAEDTQEQAMPASVYEDRELESGQGMRFLAYRVAWSKCLGRMQKIIQQLQNSSANAVIEEVQASYTNVLPGLPYPELPIVSVINPALGSSFIDDISTHLENGNSSQNPKSIVTHLYPGDFPNISTGMRSIISTFVEREEMLEQVKRKPSTSLANYDIKFLLAWYRTWLKTSGLSRVNLVVVLHDFEQFDPLVMQDVFYICSGSVSELPLVFLLSMSSPSSNYLNTAYPRATMSLLRARTFTAPSGPGILQEVLLKTFFDADFQPDIMIGPAILEYLQDYFTRFHSSVDAILTILQLAHLRHFSSDPMTVLVHSTPSLDILSQPTSTGFVNSLSSRLVHLDPVEDVDLDEPHLFPNISLAIEKVDNTRRSFYSRLRDLRIRFGIMLCIQTFLEEQGYRGLAWSTDLKKGGLCNAMLSLLRGHLGRDVKEVAKLTRLLKRDELRGLLDSLHAFFFDLPAYIRTEENAARTQLVQMKSSIVASDVSAETPQDIAAGLSEWLAEYLGEKLIQLEDYDLWDIWYTGFSPFPSELLNPSIPASLMAGLLRPHDYAEDINGNTNANASTEPPNKDIFELPDASILFKRYLDSGKMINVYDWFESFKTVVDSQRTHLKELSSLRKRGKGKGKMKRQPSELEPPEDEEKWDIEVQARFIRALHELDYLGFIKHTGRKADHLLRTVFDIDDAE